MAEMRVQRRLAAILAVDVAGSLGQTHNLRASDMAYPGHEILFEISGAMEW